jgi:hypothetical protein
MKAVRKVLAWIPEFEFEIIDASCCGMSGSITGKYYRYCAHFSGGARCTRCRCFFRRRK